MIRSTMSSDSDTRQRQRRRQRLSIEDITVIDNSTLKRAVAAAAVGNAMEWFDFAIYAYIALTLGKVFFPDANDTIQLIATFGTFSAAFLARPVGGIVLGPLGDKLGRQKVLSFTMILMALCTFCIGLIPDYSSIGIWAPITLILLRMIQGFSTGGEYGGAATFIAEYSPDRKRGYMGSWLEFGTFSGYLLGALSVNLITGSMNEETLLSWGWRIPFFIAGPLGLIGLYMRLRLEETPLFMDQTRGAEPTPKNELISIFTGNLKPMLICVGLVLMWNVCYFMLLSYLPNYLSANLHYDSGKSLWLLIAVMGIMLVIQPFVGRATDKIGRKPILLIGCVAYIALSIPAFWLLQTGSTPYILGGLILLGLPINCFTGALPATLPSLFSTSIRYGALAIAFNVSVSLFGGTTPLVTSWLVDATNNLMVPAYYMMGAAIIGIITLLYTAESSSKPLQGSAPAALDTKEAKELLHEHHDNIENEIRALEGEVKQLKQRINDLVYQRPELGRDIFRR